MDRRHFLQVDQLARQAGQIASAWQPNTLEPETDQTLHLLRVSRRAMATRFEIAFPVGTPDALPAAEAALDRIDAIESLLTIYRDESPASQLNTTAHRQPQTVRPELFQLLKQCAQWTQATSGAFDVATGALSKVWGFHARQAQLPSPGERIAALQASGMRHVALDERRSSVHFRRDGLLLNFGSVGKGYALDQAGQTIRQHWQLRHTLLHGGQSSILALGTPPGQAGWRVRLRHPWDEQTSLGSVLLRDRALGTSAATFQYLEHRGRKLGHVLDPRTGWPAETMAQVSVLAPTAAEADALSTAFFILGVQAAERYCHTHPEIAAILLPADPDASPRTLNLRPDAFFPEVPMVADSPGEGEPQ